MGHHIQVLRLVLLGMLGGKRWDGRSCIGSDDFFVHGLTMAV